MCTAATFIVDRPIFIKRRPLAFGSSTNGAAATATKGSFYRNWADSDSPGPIINHFNCYCICDLNSIKGFSGCCNESQLVRSGFYDEEGGRAVSTRDGKESAPNRSK